MSFYSCFITPIFRTKKQLIPALWVRPYCVSETKQEESSDPPDPRIRPIHPLEKCMEYMDSKAYQITYGDKPVWHVYVRNFKGGRPPRTRKNCIREGRIDTGSPCPICRDEYLLPHYQNLKLLKQFISPEGGYIISTRRTGVCRTQHLNLTLAIMKAQNYGLLSFTVPHRSYDYSIYNKK